MQYFQLPPLSNEYDFEDLLCDLFNSKYKTSSFQKYRSKGNAQLGIDIFSADKLVAIQCKKKDISRNEKKLESELIRELDKSLKMMETFPHQYNTFILASTARKYPSVQDHAMYLTQTTGKDIQYWDWNTISEQLQAYYEILIKYHYLPSDYIGIENEQFHIWEGTYKFLNSTPFDPFFQTQLIIIEYPHEYIAEFEVDGFQTCIRVNCFAKVSNNKVDIYFKDYQDDDVFKSEFKKNSHILSLKYKGDELLTEWKEYKPYFSNNDIEIAFFKDQSDLSCLKKYAGEYGFDIEKYLKFRLEKICKQECEKLFLNISTRGPIELENNCLIISGLYPHMGGVEEGIIVLNLNLNELHAAILHNGVEIQIFSETQENIPLPLIDKINEWQKNKDIDSQYDFF